MVSVRSSAAYRIAMTYAAIIAWVLLLLGVAVYLATNAESRRDLDRDIATELDRLTHTYKPEDLLRELRWRQGRDSAGHLTYALFDAKGQRIAGKLDISGPPLGAGNIAVLGRDGARHVVRAGAADVGNGARLVVAGDWQEIARNNYLIIKYFLAALGFWILTSVAAGLVLAHYLRRRLKPINATANAIITGDIEWRVPVRHPGDEFDAAGRAFNLMLERIAGLIENLRQVSSDIAHDMRKPLIRLLCQTDRLGQVEGAEQRVLDLGDELLELFAAILRISEVEGGELGRGFKRVDLSTVMGEVAESFEPPLADAGDLIEWTIEPDIVVMGNHGLLAQLASNLLDNARIHTPPGTTITLTLVSEGENAKLSVEDNGPGVSPEDAERLLQRFFRAEASRTTPGNGLGLSLVAAASRAHGGSVAIEDAEPGLRVIVTLPKFRESAAEQPPLPASGGFIAKWLNGRRES